MNEKTEANRYELPKGIDWRIPSFMRGRLTREEVESGFVSHACDMAIKDFTFQLEVDPRNAWACLGRAEAWGRLGVVDKTIVDKTIREDLDEALRIFDRAIEVNPKDETSFVARAFTLAKLGNYAAAISDLEQSLSLIPQVPEESPTQREDQESFHVAPIAGRAPDPNWLTRIRGETISRRITALRSGSSDWFSEWSWPPR